MNDGLKSLFAAHLRRIRRAAARGVADGADALAAEIRARAPEDTGALRDSIRVRRGDHSRDRIVDLVVVEGGHGGEPVELHVEFGTINDPPDPFVRRSVARRRRAVRQLIRSRILGG